MKVDNDEKLDEIYLMTTCQSTSKKKMTKIALRHGQVTMSIITISSINTFEHRM